MIRGQKVIVDFDLAELYGVTTSRLNEQVTRNRKRFPEDFMFRLTKGEAEALRSQFAISNTRRGGKRSVLARAPAK
ncbi:MAG TPA: ORF6N domain-containing protein [Pyrinomonadaceae bacterium]